MVSQKMKRMRLLKAIISKRREIKVADSLGRNLTVYKKELSAAEKVLSDFDRKNG